MSNTKAYLNWSGGKDCSFALYKSRQQNEYDIQLLVTTGNEAHQRVSMHGVRMELMQQQAHALGLPLRSILLPGDVGMQQYNKVMEKEVNALHREGFGQAVFGDIFLDDLRAYREQQLQACNMQAVFPLWKQDTAALARAFIALGFRAKLVCTNAALLGEEFAGREFDLAFLDDLPAGIDPCGENGEFHTFVYDGPVFDKPVSIQAGEKVLRSYEVKTKSKEDECFASQPVMHNTAFWYADWLPV